MSNPIKHKDPEIPDDEPFKYCKLDRKKHADTLTAIVESYADGFVLALDSKWGTGKTTFVKMWKKELEKEPKSYKTIYFNAWENDFANEPLTALLGELNSIVGEKGEKYNSLVKKSVVIAKSVLPALAKGIASKYLNTDTVLDVIEKSLEATTEILEKEVDNYIEKKKNLVTFKTELEEYIKETCNNKPLIFFIDELDRCRPDYAVEVLEKVKHFFSVEGIVFVLSIDKIQLSHSVQGYYGSYKIDSTEYLRRFIDLEYQLPEPESGLFCSYLYEYYKFHEFFDVESRTKNDFLQNDGDNFFLFTKDLFFNYKYTLRQQEKIFAHIRLTLKCFNLDYYLFPTTFLILIHLKYFNEDVYNNIKKKSLIIQNLINNIENIFINVVETRYLIDAETFLLTFYNNSLETQEVLIRKNGAIEELNLITKLDQNDFLNHLKRFKPSLVASTISIDYLINKIDLLEPLILIN
ncbi:MAG: P-loop NTPase fold protein [Paludibacteraceae bacterium]|nr:P-loop NTPase fold protein [Paludibacteraceae bacterium]